MIKSENNFINDFLKKCINILLLWIGIRDEMCAIKKKLHVGWNKKKNIAFLQ